MIRTFFRRVRLIFSSLRFRLMAWFGLVLAVVLVVFSAFIYTRQAQDLHDVIISRLAGKTRQLEGLFQLSGLQSLQEVRLLLPALVNQGVSIVQEDEVLAFTDPQGQWYATVGLINEDDINRLTTAVKGSASSSKQQLVDLNLAGAASPGQQYLFLVTPVVTRLGSNTGYMLVGRPADPTGQLPRLLLTLALSSLAVLAGVGITGYWLAGRALRPVQTITHAAQEISETDLSRRLNLATHDELGELAATFDGMLARLQAAFERQRQFTADASHELRTPLTIISLETSRVLDARRSPKEYEQVLRLVQAENEHMTHLVNDLLTLARLDSGQAGLQREALDLSDVALEVLERMAPLAAQKGVHLQAGELPEAPALGDRAALVQVVSSLVENAIKYTPGGEGRVVVRAGAGEGSAWVQVEDNGPGIAAEHLPHLFERFYRVDPSRSGESEGSGLGLAIARGIARAQGGDVTVQSEPGRGSTFELRLPQN